MSDPKLPENLDRKFRDLDVALLKISDRLDDMDDALEEVRGSIRVLVQLVHRVDDRLD